MSIAFEIRHLAGTQELELFNSIPYALTASSTRARAFWPPLVRGASAPLPMSAMSPWPTLSSVRATERSSD